MRIAVYGGSFSPFHNGHAMVAAYLAQWCDVDEVWVMPSPQNPLKSDSESIFNNRLRLDLARVGVEDIGNVKCSDFEYSLPRPYYTINTLRRLQEEFPQHEFTLVIGGDNWEFFHKWKDWKEILANFNIIVYPRPGAELPPIPTIAKNVEVLKDAPQMLISGTFLRDALSQGKSIAGFVPQSVSRLIIQNKQSHEKQDN